MKKPCFVILLYIVFISNSFAGKSINILSYNLGLAHTFVPLAKERLPYLIKTLSESQADILCLQEVWTESDRKEVVKTLSKKFPYSVKMKIKQKFSRQRPTCRIKDVFGKGKFVNCIQKDCKGTSGDDFTSCVIKKCRGSLERLKEENSDCAQGILSQVGKTTLQALIAVFNPFKGAGLFSYKGSDGLLVLSKYKLHNHKTIDLEKISTGTRRRVLLADLYINDRKMTIGCTHLTANLSRSVPYTGEFTGWEMENMAQVKKVILKTKKIENPLVLAGDYNCSIDDPKRGVGDEFGKSCELFKSDKFEDLFFKENGKCTYCEKNTLVNKTDAGEKNFLLDHIFTKNVDVVESNLIYDTKIEISKGEEIIESHLSDHFGVTLELDL